MRPIRGRKHVHPRRRTARMRMSVRSDEYEKASMHNSLPACPASPASLVHDTLPCHHREGYLACLMPTLAVLCPSCLEACIHAPIPTVADYFNQNAGTNCLAPTASPRVCPLDVGASRHPPTTTPNARPVRAGNLNLCSQCSLRRIGRPTHARPPAIPAPSRQRGTQPPVSGPGDGCAAEPLPLLRWGGGSCSLYCNISRMSDESRGR